MKPEKSARRRLRDSRNNSFSLSFNNVSNESGLSILMDSPVLFNSPKVVPPKPSILKKRKSISSCQHSRESTGHETIILDSSCEVIDKSSCSTGVVCEFDWINTPRSARNRNKFKVDSISDQQSSTIPKKRKSTMQSVKDQVVSKKNIIVEPVNRKQVKAKTKTPNFLAGSKRRNVESWVTAAVDQPVTTPPMSLSPPTKQSEYDPIVARELRLLYGDDWNAKPLKRSQTTIKRSKCKSPQRLLTDVRPPSKPTNLQQSEAKINRKNVRRKVFGDFPFNKLGTDDNVEKSGIRSTTKKLRTKTSPGKEDQTPSKCSNGLKTPRRTFLASLSVSTPTTANHPEALSYKLNFAKRKEDLCYKLFKLYNSEVFSNKLPGDMLIEWNSKMRGTAGFCYSKRRKTRDGIVRSSRLELSSRVIDRADRLRDTLIHELCHAAAWVIDGVRDGHGSIWLSWANKAATRFPELPLIKRCHNYQIATKFTYRCTVCSYSINRQSRSIDVNRKRCGRCYGILELLFNKKKRGLTEAPEFETTRTIRAPNRFALFVKENYKLVKSSVSSDKKHADIMKLLSEKYADAKNNFV